MYSDSMLMFCVVPLGRRFIHCFGTSVKRNNDICYIAPYPNNCSVHNYDGIYIMCYDEVMYIRF